MDPYEALEKGDWRTLEEFARSKGYNTDFMPLEYMISNSYYFKKEYYMKFGSWFSDTTPRTHWFNKYDDVFTLVKRNEDSVYYTDCWHEKDDKKLHLSTGKFPEIIDDHYMPYMSIEENNIITLASVRRMRLLNFKNIIFGSFLRRLDIYLTRLNLEDLHSFYGKDAINFISGKDMI